MELSAQQGPCTAGNYVFEWFETAVGSKTVRMVDSAGQPYLLHSLVNPVKEAKTLVDTLDTTKSALYIIFGVGMGYHLRVLKEQISPSSRVIVLEPQQEFLGLWHEQDVIQSINDQRFTFLAGSLDKVVAEIDKLLYGQNIMVSGNCRFLVLPAYKRLFSDWVAGLQKRIVSLIKNRWFEMGNDVADTLQGIRQTMENLGQLVSSPGANQLAGAYGGKPAIIVSAGPSLNKNVDLLHEVKGKALILCVDASYRVLLEKGIVPDAIFSIERGIETYNQFYRNCSLPREPVLIAPPVIYPEIFEEYPGEKVVLLRANEGVSKWFEHILQKGMIQMGTSVAHLAFGFAQLIKADPVIFIGQDLAYSPEGYSHGSGVSVNKKQDFSKIDTWVEGYEGQKLPSTKVWKNFLTWFETAAASSDALCIDATEGGARIKGTEILTLKEAISAYCVDNALEPLNILIAKLQKEMVDTNAAKDLNRVFNAFRELITYFDQLADDAAKAHNRLTKIERETNFTNSKRGKLFKVIQKIAKNDRIVERIVQNKMAVMCFQTMLFLANQQLAELGDRLTAENVQKNIRIQRWFLERVWKVAEKVSIELQKMLESTINKPQLRTDI